MPGPKPKVSMIRGIFLTGHVDRLREVRGLEAVKELERRWGAPLLFRSLKEVPVQDEARLLEHIVEIMDGPQSPSVREYLAGRLHFENFLETTMGSTLMRALPRNKNGLTTLLSNAGSIIRFVFSNMEMSCEQQHKALVVVMRNSGYPPEHFRGFFDALMSYCKVQEGASLRIISPGVHQFTLPLV